MLGTLNGQLAIIRPEFVKMEAELQGGLARISQRIELTEAKLVMDGRIGDIYLSAGDTVVLRGDAGLQQWAKTGYRLKGIESEFVLCPESQVIGFRRQPNLKEIPV